MTGELTTDRPSWTTRAIRFLGVAMALIGWTVCGTGVALHGLVVDRWTVPWCFLYYALPRPVLCLIAAACLSMTPRAFPRLVRMARIIFALMMAWVLLCDVGWRLPKQSVAEPRLRIAFWNACHLPRGRESAANVIRGFNADLVGLVEAGSTGSAELADWERLLPDYHADSNRPGMLWLSRLPGGIAPVVHLGPGSDAAALEFEFAHQRCRAVLVDISADFEVARVPVLVEMSRRLDEDWDDRPWLLLGDFNAPPESVGFSQLRQRSIPVFSAAGSGYAATWPVPLPVLTLDQIWMPPEWQAHACRHLWTACSDHRPVVAELTIATTPHVAKSQR